MLQPGNKLALNESGGGAAATSTKSKGPRANARPLFESDDTPLNTQRPVDFANKLSKDDFETEKVSLDSF